MTRQFCRVSSMMLCLLSACLLLFLTKDAAAASELQTPDPSSATHTSPTINQSEDLLCDCTPKRCPALLDDQSVAEYTMKCCRNTSVLTFHIQRAKDDQSCLCACVPVIICPAGMIPILHHFQKDKALFAYLECKPCEDGSFEPRSRKSYEYRDPVCPKIHQICKADRGYAMVRKGNSTHDTTCRCLWEKGFVPLPNDTFVCNSSVTGFKDSDLCTCVQSPCPSNMRRNNEYRCVPIPPPTEEPDKSTANYEEGDTETPDVTRPKRRISKEQEAAPEENRGADWWGYLISLFLVFFTGGIVLAWNFRPRT